MKFRLWHLPGIGIFWIIIAISFCQSPDLSERAPVNNLQAISRPIYLMGRLPGDHWKEHNPPRMKARQSFWGYDEFTPCILALYSKKNEHQDAKSFVKDFTDRISNTHVIKEEPFHTGEGDWVVVSLKPKSSNGIARIYSIQKDELVYWVQLSAPNWARFSICVPDTKTYIRNLYFLYDE